MSAKPKRRLIRSSALMEREPSPDIVLSSKKHKGSTTSLMRTSPTLVSSSLKMSAKPKRRLTRSTALMEREPSPDVVLSNKKHKRSTTSLMRTSPTLVSSSKKLTNKIKTTYSSLEETEGGPVKVEKSSIDVIKPNNLKRKIVKARRLLRSKAVQSDEEPQQKEVQQEPINLSNQSHKSVYQINVESDGEECINIIEDKKDTGSIKSSFAVNEQADETFIKTSLDSFEEKRSSIESKFTITALNEPISPSISSLDLKTPSKSPEHLQFDCSEEILYPTCDSSPPKKRRTFELEASVNDITLLKSVSKDDSVRMNSFPSDPESLPSPIEASSTIRLSKVTVRKKWQKSNTVDRISRFSPPWSRLDTSSSESGPEEKPAKKSDATLKDTLTKGESKSTIKKIKMPNFAAIHQKAYEKMESLSEYKKRKEERAKVLLSGMKPINQKSNTEKPKSNTRKQLAFTADTVDKPKSSTFIPLPSTPMPKRKLTIDSPEVNSPVFNFKREKRYPSTPMPNHKFPKNDSFKVKTPHLTKEKENCKPAPFKIHFKVGTPNFKFTQVKDNGPVFFKNIPFKNEALKKTKIPTKIFAEKNNVGMLPLCSNRPNVKNVFLKEELKAMVATKSKPKKIDVESRRTIIKGVRSNRRFELLMDMRKGK